MQRNKLANLLPYLVVILAIISLLGLNMGASSERISYYELQNVIEKEKVDEVSVSIGTNVTVVKGVYEKDKQKVTFTATIPSTSDQIGKVIKSLGNESTKLTIVDADLLGNSGIHYSIYLICGICGLDVKPYEWRKRSQCESI